ncbi:MAG: ABC transporter substrate-binding protein [Thermodesulfobacteriota bacterium]
MAKRRTLVGQAGLATGCLVVMAAVAAGAAEIPIGMSTVLSGPAQALGEGMKTGVETYFKKVNAAGGVNGNTLRLVVYDDGYEPDRCAPNMHRLIDEDKVLAVIGNVGTPTAIVAVPIANEKKTLLFGAFTGAGVLRKSPPDRYVINFRASYEEETGAMIQGFLAAGIKPEEIAFFTQNDGYGDAGYAGAIKALKTQGYAAAESLAHGRYTRNTENVEDGLATVLGSSPKAVIMVGAYKPCAKFITMAKEILPETLYANVSFVGSVALAKELGPAGEGVIVTQVVPPADTGLAAVQEYRADLATYAPGAAVDFVSLEGYLAAKVFVEGLKKAGATPTREGLVDAIEGLTGLEIGIGFPIGFGKTDHQASGQVWPTIIRNGSFVSLDWKALQP